MKNMITILCSGSRGDSQPYIALAMELKRLGKEYVLQAAEALKVLFEVTV